MSPLGSRRFPWKRRSLGRFLTHPAQGPRTMPEDDVSQLSFEDALAELDQIVRGLEGGTLKLDAAVQAFERGVKLRRHCEAKLAEVEARVEALVQRTDGSLGTRPLE
jgi:exodeoxyribonuclease VII small subunit